MIHKTSIDDKSNRKIGSGAPYPNAAGKRYLSVDLYLGSKWLHSHLLGEVDKASIHGATPLPSVPHVQDWCIRRKFNHVSPISQLIKSSLEDFGFSNPTWFPPSLQSKISHWFHRPPWNWDEWEPPQDNWVCRTVWIIRVQEFKTYYDQFTKS